MCVCVYIIYDYFCDPLWAMYTKHDNDIQEHTFKNTTQCHQYKPIIYQWQSINSTSISIH